MNTEQPTTGTCAKCRQTRPLFSFEFVPDGWYEFITRMLCARCWSVCTEADERDESGALNDLVEFGLSDLPITAPSGAK